MWRYAPVARVLHWVLAVLVACMVAVGWYMTGIEDDPGADRYFDLHKSTGIVVFSLLLLRLAWRLRHPPAALPASVPKWQARAALVVHRLLYACLILMPLTGFLGASHTKSGVAFFGLPLPRWRAPDRDTAELFFGIHGAIAWILVALVALHTLAALKHLLVDRDRVFQRMWF
jgi:cytochrome b561